jgi:hypothetical protein
VRAISQLAAIPRRSRSKRNLIAQPAVATALRAVHAQELRSGRLIGRPLEVRGEEAQASLTTDTRARVPTGCLRLRMMFVISSVVRRRRIRKRHIVGDVVVSNAADVERLGIKPRENRRWTCPEIA